MDANMQSMPKNAAHVTKAEIERYVRYPDLS